MSLSSSPGSAADGDHRIVILEELDGRRRSKGMLLLFLLIQPIALLVFLVNAWMASLAASFFAASWIVLMALQSDRVNKGWIRPKLIEANDQFVRFTEENGNSITYAWNELVGNHPEAKPDLLSGERDMQLNFLNDGWRHYLITKKNDDELMERYRAGMKKDPPMWDELYFEEMGVELDDPVAMEHFRIRDRELRKGFILLAVAYLGSIAVAAFGAQLLDHLGPAFVLSADGLVIVAILISIATNVVPKKV